MRPRTPIPNEFPEEGGFAIADYGSQKVVVLSLGNAASSTIRGWSNCKVLMVWTSTNSFSFTVGKERNWMNDGVAIPVTLKDLKKQGINIPPHFAQYHKLITKAKKSGWTQNEHGYWYHADYWHAAGVREEKLIEFLQKLKE